LERWAWRWPCIFRTRDWKLSALIWIKNKSLRQKNRGLAAGDDLASQVSDIDVFIVIVATDKQTESVVETILSNNPKTGAAVVVAATNHPDTMTALAPKCAAAGVRFVDAPVVFGMQGARDGNLASLCGGSKDDVEYVTPVLMCYSRAVHRVGDVGAGQLGKTCNNMMHWAACCANFEVLALAKRYGVDAQHMREILLECPARNTTLIDGTTLGLHGKKRTWMLRWSWRRPRSFRCRYSAQSIS